jgi:hypothetical protein
MILVSNLRLSLHSGGRRMLLIQILGVKSRDFELRTGGRVLKRILVRKLRLWLLLKTITSSTIP